MKNDIMLKEPELSFDSIHQELNNFLRDTFMESAFSHPLNLRKISSWRPAIELKQTEKEYKVKVQLPGVNKEDIHVDLNNDYMTVTAEIKEEKSKDNESEKIHASEFRYGKYIRTVSFENPIKSDESVAEYKNGVLTISMPKQKIEKTKSKRLAIK
ncbi:MAG: Hsp20/alpha crystallin family protein [Candidatus Gastranaerophilaceae bacterium]